MGVLLPFISSCLDPNTSGLWSTDPGVLNLFWINIAASRRGERIARMKLISEPFEYMIDSNFDITFPDFEVSRFTRAGMYSTSIFIMYYPYMLSSYVLEISIPYIIPHIFS